jgi:hypothetical protein
MYVKNINNNTRRSWIGPKTLFEVFIQQLREQKIENPSRAAVGRRSYRRTEWSLPLVLYIIGF